jgi:hypothetical protein
MEKTYERNIRLLGDSIFDNAAYVPGEPPVAEQLQVKLKSRSIRVKLSAVDGAVTRNVLENQLPDSAMDRELLVLSTGGNDALGHIGLLHETSTAKPAEILSQFHFIREGFRRDYARLLDTLNVTGCPVLVCTIYNPDFGRSADTRNLQEPAEAALSFFNDVIVQEATKRGFPTLDLREVSTESSDFANPIEPSAQGGDKITDRICEWVISTLECPSNKCA